MGLKCSLLGHSFGEATVEREREERGSEVVTIVREREECSRCGEERVVSENKEVTSVVEPEEVGLDDAPGAGSFNDDEFEPPASIEDEDAEIIEDSPDDAEREPGEWPEEPSDAGDWESDAEDAPDAARDEPAGASEEAASTDRGGPAPEGEPATAGDSDAGAGERDLETGADEPATTVPQGRFACPECGFEVEAGSSFREGDACPECQQGYLQR